MNEWNKMKQIVYIYSLDSVGLHIWELLLIVSLK